MFAVKVFALLTAIAVFFVLLAEVLGKWTSIGALLGVLTGAVICFGGSTIYNIVTRKKLIERYRNERGN